MAKDLVQEAYAQIDAMRDAATETAKNILIEAMSTDLKAAVAQAMNDTIGEEVVSEEVDESSEENETPIVEENIEEVEEETIDEGEETDTDEMYEEEDEDDMDMDDEDEDDDEEEDDDMEEMMDEEVIEVVEDVNEGEVEESDEIVEGDELSQLKSENETLRQENKKYEKALISVKKQMDEINLFNARLAAATDLMRSTPLTKTQKEKVVENFDSAKSLGEVKRMHNILKEAYKNTEKTVSKARVSRPNVQSVVTESKETVNNSAFERLSRLAGV